jgi:hypothetical protein
MQQAQILVSPTGNVSVIFAAWREVHYGHNFLPIFSWFFTVVFTLDNESLKHDASLTRMPISTSTCTKIFVLTLSANYYYPHFSLFL